MIYNYYSCGSNLTLLSVQVNDEWKNRDIGEKEVAEKRRGEKEKRGCAGRSLTEMLLDGVDNFFVDGQRALLRKEVMVLMLNAEVVEVAEKKFEEVWVVLVFEVESQHDMDNVGNRPFSRESFRKLHAGVENVG
eukprot:g40779.t1